MNIDELTLGQLKEISKTCGVSLKSTNKAKLPFSIGDKLLILTVTSFHVGILVSVTREFFVLNDGGWVANTGRLGNALDTGNLVEFERAPREFGVARNAIVSWYPWLHAIPQVSK